jgi:hypothetical protein
MVESQGGVIVQRNVGGNQLQPRFVREEQYRVSAWSGESGRGASRVSLAMITRQETEPVGMQSMPVVFLYRSFTH